MSIKAICDRQKNSSPKPAAQRQTMGIATSGFALLAMTGKIGRSRDGKKKSQVALATWLLVFSYWTATGAFFSSLWVRRSTP